jgi:hypothetical protein
MRFRKRDKFYGNASGNIYKVSNLGLTLPLSA